MAGQNFLKRCLQSSTLSIQFTVFNEVRTVTTHTAHSVAERLQKGCSYVAVQCSTGGGHRKILATFQQCCGAILLLQRFGNGHATFRRFYSNFLATFLRFYSNCPATFRRFHSNFLATFRRLYSNCLATFRRFYSNVHATFRRFYSNVHCNFSGILQQRSRSNQGTKNCYNIDLVYRFSIIS